MKWNSIKFKTTALILIIGLTSMVIFSFFSYINTKESLEKKYFDQSEQVLKHSLLQFQDMFNHADQFIEDFAELEEIQRVSTTSEPLWLKTLIDFMQKTISNSSRIKFGIANGKVYMGLSVDIPSNYDPREQIWYKGALQSNGRTVWSEPYLDYVDQKIIMTSSRTVLSTIGNLVGVIGVDFDLSSISQIIGCANMGKQGFVLLLNPNGTVIANEKGYWIGERLFGDEMEQIAHKAETEQLLYDIKGNSYYLKLGKLMPNGMMVVTGISKQEINEDLWKIHLPVFLIGLFCLAVFGILAYLFALRGIAPVVRLVTLMKSVEQGNYDVHARVDSYDEVRALSNGFNHMIDGIRYRDQDLIASKERNYRLAYFDALTNLLNRRSLMESISESIQFFPDSNKAFIYIDLDNFKSINDTLGHLAGDDVLREVAERFQSIPYEDKMAARIGGDEFIVVLNNAEVRDDVEAIIQFIIAALVTPIMIKGQSYQISSSIGVAFYPEHGDHAEELLQKSDMAMYRAKQNGKNQYSIYDESIQIQIARKSRIEHGIKEALRNEQFELYFQPIYELESGRIGSVEALLRHHSPLLIDISTFEIIQTAEKSGSIVHIEKWVFNHACTFAKQLNEGRSRLVRVTINASGNHIMQPEFVSNVKSILNKTAVNPEWIGIEITETVMMESFDSNKRKLEELKNLGIKMYLDDFGTGYSSLNYLKSLPIDYVKIDKSFLGALSRSGRDSRIMKSIVELSHNIGLKVIAEGVEHKEQLDVLRDYECDMVQGYYLSKPLSAEDALNLLKDNTKSTL